VSGELLCGVVFSSPSKHLLAEKSTHVFWRAHDANLGKVYQISDMSISHIPTQVKAISDFINVLQIRVKSSKIVYD
jgi:hypothetical protein